MRRLSRADNRRVTELRLHIKMLDGQIIEEWSSPDTVAELRARRLKAQADLGSIILGSESDATLTPDEQDFIQHLEKMHRIPANILGGLGSQALADFHEAEHASPLWTLGPHHD